MACLKVTFSNRKLVYVHTLAVATNAFRAADLCFEYITEDKVKTFIGSRTDMR